MKHALIFLFCLVIIVPNVKAQAPNAKWVSVFATAEQNVYLDTSNVKQTESQITSLCLTIYKEPVLVGSINKNAKSIKSQIFFNKTEKKYTVIGTLFYDGNWKIIGETSLPGLSVGNPTLAVPIDSNEIMKAVYDKSVEIITKKNNESAASEVSKNTVKGKTASTKSEKTQAATKDTSKTIDKRESLTEKFIDKKLSEETEAAPMSKQKESKPSTKTTAEANSDYSLSEEKNLHGTIFTDGTQYCFQVSSWKIKSKAESEVERLKKLGHNAFITEVYISNRGGTWYRVRIGYFNSLEETESYLKRMR
ncbi:MAG: SPOR domain-containing protein [Ignavibacteriales bacterium]|nr:SPOR domain-containing protein [Ignavibacteriales bacterium]